MKKCIITVVGKDKVGIIAAVCQYLTGISVNILNISQTIVEGYFNMMRIVDISIETDPLRITTSGLKGLVDELAWSVILISMKSVVVGAGFSLTAGAKVLSNVVRYASSRRIRCQ